MKKEIEIKIPLDKKTFLKIKKRLFKIAKFKQKSRQIDNYFTPFHP